jgi:hypothetical protein
MIAQALLASTAIVLLSFISEDAATISSALSLFGGPINWQLGFLGGFVQDPAAACCIRHGLAEAITHRPGALSKHNRASGSVLRDCPGGFSGTRCPSSGCLPLRLLRYRSLVHKRLPRGLP